MLLVTNNRPDSDYEPIIFGTLPTRVNSEIFLQLYMQTDMPDIKCRIITSVSMLTYSPIHWQPLWEVNMFWWLSPSIGWGLKMVVQTTGESPMSCSLHTIWKEKRENMVFISLPVAFLVNTESALEMQLGLDWYKASSAISGGYQHYIVFGLINWFNYIS